MMHAKAFHEKAGRSQDDSFFILSGKLLLLAFLLRRRVANVAMLPSALSRTIGFARYMVGVLGSAGAAI
jgi:hypothetical protein